MTPEQFKAWRNGMGLSRLGAAQRLDVSKAAVQAWEQGVNPIGKTVSLACCALWFGLGRWEDIPEDGLRSYVPSEQE